MAILTLTNILKYLSVAIVVAIILFVMPGDKLDKNNIALIALGAAVFSLVLDLLFSYLRKESMDNVQGFNPSPYDPRNIYGIDNELPLINKNIDPKQYQFIDREEDGILYYKETGLPGYYLINNGEFSDGNVAFDTSSSVIDNSREQNFDKVNFNDAMAPCNLFMPELGKDRPYPNIEPVPVVSNAQALAPAK